MNNESGFTLLEIIASLVLLSIMATMAGLWIVLGARGYVFTRENSIIVQKAGMVMARIERELLELSALDIAASDDGCIRFKAGTVSSYYRAIGLNGTELELKVSDSADCDCNTSGFLLGDSISDFTISYEDSAGTSPVPSTPPADLEDLVAIHVDFTINRSDGTDAEKFETIVNPRNNGNPNGPGAL